MYLIQIGAKTSTYYKCKYWITKWPSVKGRRYVLYEIQKYKKMKVSGQKVSRCKWGGGVLYKKIITIQKKRNRKCPGVKGEEERKEKELLKGRVRELEEEVGK